MITKTQINNTLADLPENITVEQLIERLIFLDKIQKGIDDSESGKVNTVQEAKEKLGKWLK